jgi:hypothetical protein
MKEEHENSGMERPEPDGAVPPSTAEPARAALGEWRAPAFWMTCGALLVMLVMGAVMLVQRVGVERDMMAVAATATAADTAVAAPGTAAAPTASAAAAPGATGAVPAAPAPVAPRIAAQEAPGRSGLADTPAARAEPPARAPAAAPPKVRAGSLAPGARATGRAPAASRPAAALPAVKATAKPPRKDGAKRKLKRSTRSKIHTQEGNYAKIFIRCPLPGEPGSVECRRHICNGAESEGPACKPYKGRWR